MTATLAVPGSISYERAGLRFHATLGGPDDGELAVLLHGFPGSRATWDFVAPLLHLAGVRTVALEQRGYGESARPASVAAYRLGELGADVIGLLDHLDERRCHLVGHDWGGIVAWYLAAVHPERIESLTVLSTPHPRAFARSLGRSLQGLRSTYAVAFQVPVAPEALLTAGHGRLLETSLRWSGLDPDHAARYAADLSAPDAMRAALGWYRAAFRHPGDVAVVGTIGVPTTYVWSRGDVALGGTAARATGDHVDADYRFVVLDDVPHWIPELEPARTAALVADRIRAGS